MDVTHIIEVFGTTGITAIIFAESGLFFGFFLPGDSILFTAGFLASTGFLNLAVLLPLVWLAAVIGDSVGYWFGAKFGIKVFNKERSFFFNKRYPERASEFYEKYGGQAITLARFIPAVRTFVPIMAGVGKMPYKRFLSFNIIGGTIWTVGLTLAGYFLGRIIPGVDKYILPIVLLIIILSGIPALIQFYKAQKS